MALRFESVSAGYHGRPVLHGIDLVLGPGLHVVLGANGSGKTTFFRTGAGILAPLAGRVLLDGADTARDVAAKTRIGYVSHRSGFGPSLSVADNLLFWAKVMRLAPAPAARAIAAVGERLELGALLPKHFGTLSRGQQQRVSVARALLADPALLFVDEPTGGLDPHAAKRLRGLLRELAAAGTIIVFTTHDLHEADELGADVLLLEGGTFGYHGSLAEARATADGDRRPSRLDAIYERLEV
jgi:ABC-2 type transport system ATP-binding protein